MTEDLYLIGFMGSGKSAVGRALRSLVYMEMIDMDRAIAEAEGMSIPEIFREKGEAYFRAQETAFLKRRARATSAIISCGGGVPLRGENVALMRARGPVVYLDADPETIYERVKRGRDRPLLNDHMDLSYIREMMEGRRPRYEAAADITVRTDGKEIRAIAEEITALLSQRGQK